MRRIAMLLLCAAALSGCPRKSSAKFYDAEGRYSVILVKLGDDAYADAEMERIVTTLKEVPPNALEADKALALLAKIDDEKKRVATEAAERARSLDSAGQPTVGTSNTGFTGFTVPMPIAPVIVKDGGLPDIKPWPGMSELEFLARFAGCVDRPAATSVPGEKSAVAYVVRNTPDCQKRYGAAEGALAYVFVNGKLQGQAVQSQTTEVRDAGYFSVVLDASVTEYNVVTGMLPVDVDAGSQ